MDLRHVDRLGGRAQVCMTVAAPRGLPQMIEGKMLADMVPTFDTINMIGGEVEQ